MATTPLTLAAIRALQPGQTLWDHVVTGLHVRRRAESVSFSLYYRAHSGARRTLKLGGWPQLTLELARDAARELLRDVATGKDPSEEKQESRAAPLVSDLAKEWETRKAPPVKKPRSFREDQYNLKNHVLPALGAMRVRDVMHSDVRRLVDSVAAGSGPSAARAVRMLVSGLFTLASHPELKWRERHANPAQDVPTPTTARRNVRVQAEEFARLAAELEALRPAWPEHVACIWVALYCGTRITELATARSVQLQGNQLILAEHKTQATGNERVIRLSAAARHEIEQLPTHDSGHLFGALGAMGDGARRSIHYVFGLARDKAGCPHIRPQDLRRTFASVAKSKGVSLSQVGELFGHTSAQTTMRYAWLFDDAAQETADSVADEIKRLAGAADHPTQADT